MYKEPPNISLIHCFIVKKMHVPDREISQREFNLLAFWEYFFLHSTYVAHNIL